MESLVQESTRPSHALRCRGYTLLAVSLQCKAGKWRVKGTLAPNALQQPEPDGSTQEHDLCHVDTLILRVQDDADLCRRV